MMHNLTSFELFMIKMYNSPLQLGNIIQKLILNNLNIYNIIPIDIIQPTYFLIYDFEVSINSSSISKISSFSLSHVSISHQINLINHAIAIS